MHNIAMTCIPLLHRPYTSRIHSAHLTVMIVPHSSNGILHVACRVQLGYARANYPAHLVSARNASYADFSEQTLIYTVLP